MGEIEFEKYSSDFDQLVSDYNNWLKSLEDPELLRLDSLCCLEKTISEFRSNNCIFSRKDLNEEQKEAIILASDLRKISKSLSQITCGNVENLEITEGEARMKKSEILGLYGSLKDVYISCEIKKNFDK